MRIEWSDEFDHWFAKLEEEGRRRGHRRAEGLQLHCRSLRLAPAPACGAPGLDDGTAQLKPVRQSRRYQVWRTAHPFDPDVAVRLIVWFPPGSDSAVVTLFAGDKKTIGDIWYASVGTRADAAIERWFREQEGDDHG